MLELISNYLYFIGTTIIYSYPLHIKYWTLQKNYS